MGSGRNAPRLWGKSGGANKGVGWAVSRGWAEACDWRELGGVGWQASRRGREGSGYFLAWYKV